MTVTGWRIIGIRDETPAISVVTVQLEGTREDSPWNGEQTMRLMRIMDWDRKQQAWRSLDEEDDNKSFAITGLDALPEGTPRVVLCVSASYDVLDADIGLVEPGMPIVRMDLQDRSTASHWSEAKQRRLAQEFLHVAMALSRLGVSEIALFLACPASIALRFGTIYDKRNLPSLEVNQYEQANPKKFPWAVRMPVAGLAVPALKHR